MIKNKLENYTVNKILRLVWLLDRLKMMNMLDRHCLFGIDSEVRGSNQGRSSTSSCVLMCLTFVLVIHIFTTAYCVQGKVAASTLSTIGYHLEYKRHVVDEYNFFVKALTDLTDGVVLTRIGEIYQNDHLHEASKVIPTLKPTQPKFSPLALNSL